MHAARAFAFGHKSRKFVLCDCCQINCRNFFTSPSLFSSLFCFLAGEDGQTLPINRRQRAYNNGTLIIEQLQRLEDAGTYTCMAQNKQKQTSRRNVEIQVLGEYCVYVMWAAGTDWLSLFRIAYTHVRTGYILFFFVFPSPNIQIRKLPLPPHTMKLFQLEWQQNYVASSKGNSSNYFQLPALLMHMHRCCAGRGKG